MTPPQPPAVYCPNDRTQRSKQSHGLHAEPRLLDKALKLRDRGVSSAIDRHVDEVLRFVLCLLAHWTPKHLAAGTNKGVFAAATKDDDDREDSESIPDAQDNEPEENRHRNDREQNHHPQARS